jgi:ribonucleotide monophosphatase NagD (HAD superfamily)
MMTKKDFKELANMCSGIDNDNIRMYMTNSLIVFCRKQNPRFDAKKFIEWIRRVRANESLKGLR